MEINYIFSLGELFERVQTEKVFPDNKTFVDCTPKSSLSDIHDRYEREKNEPNFDLSSFVHTHFTEPVSFKTDFVSVKGRPIKEHIEKLFIEYKLRKFVWNVSKTAEVLDIQRSHLYNKIEKYDLRRN